MMPAFLATLLFSVSVIAASRSVRLLGSLRANLGRTAVATVLLGLWAHTLGNGFGGGAFLMFFVSGCVGFGIGDMALFAALPRLGPRRSSLMINCLAAPFAAAVEWYWLGTRLSPSQLGFGLAVLLGVGLALLPEGHLEVRRPDRVAGILCGILAGFGQGVGAVLSRKGYAMVAAAGRQLDAGTAAYQRILGGLAIISLPFVWFALREQIRGRTSAPPARSPQDRRAAWSWVLVNGFAGPTVGVGFYQWALKTTPAGIVLPITATTPLLVIPFTYWFEGDRPSARSIAGAALAVVGVVGLTLVS